MTSCQSWNFRIESVTRERNVARVRGFEVLPNGTKLPTFDLILLPWSHKVRDIRGWDLTWSPERVTALTAATFEWVLHQM